MSVQLHRLKELPANDLPARLDISDVGLIDIADLADRLRSMNVPLRELPAQLGFKCYTSAAGSVTVFVVDHADAADGGTVWSIVVARAGARRP